MSIQIIKTLKFSNKNIKLYGSINEPWFIGKHICDCMEIKKHRDILKKLDSEYKKQTSIIVDGCSQARKMTLINEEGLYMLAFMSQKKEAIQFKKWCCSVLVEIRKTGQYKQKPKYIKNTCYLSVQNEKDLHYQVVRSLRQLYGDSTLLIIPGLGELQTTSEARIDAYNKGYQAGQPDLQLFFKNLKIAIELKSPTGLNDVTDKQHEQLEKFKANGFICIVSNNLLDLMKRVNELIMKETYEIRYKSSDGLRSFKTLRGLERYNNKQ